jgi:SAM-dependent methyltransferase
MNTSKISDILLKYKTDKNHGTIKNIYNNLEDRIVVDNPEPSLGHTYGATYDEIFETFDKNDNINILEIGIQKGGSLVAWKEYFPNANIYGVDIIDSILDEYRNNNFTYIIADIKSDLVKKQLQNIKFDIIIDDGSHQLYDVLFTVNNYLDHLKPNGYFIIEDCQIPEFWLHEINKIVPENFIVINKDLRNNISYDNYLIIIKKI